MPINAAKAGARPIAMKCANEQSRFMRKYTASLLTATRATPRAGRQQAGHHSLPPPPAASPMKPE